MRSSLALVVALLLLACGPENTPSTPGLLASERSAILDGKTDSSQTAVVGVYRDAGNDSELCTGYVIMPDLVLTARHCVSKLAKPTAGCGGATQTTAGVPFDAAKFAVLTATSPGSPKGLSVAEVSVLGEDILCGNDLALLRLDAPLGGVTPIALRLDSTPAVGETLTVVGYGASKGGPDTTSGVRRSLEGVTVQSVGAGAKTVEGEWVVSEGPCAGDSGGPALDASGASIGVMSRGNQATCKSMIYERLDVHAGWLRQAGQAAAARLGIDAPAWALDTAGEGGASGQGGEAGQGAGTGGAAGEGDSGAGGEGTEQAGGSAGQTGSNTAGVGGATAGAAGQAGQSAPGQAGAPAAAGRASEADDGGCSAAAPARGEGRWGPLMALLVCVMRGRARPRTGVRPG